MPWYIFSPFGCVDIGAGEEITDAVVIAKQFGGKVGANTGDRRGGARMAVAGGMFPLILTFSPKGEKEPSSDRAS
jgi:hypothetical protein